MDRAPFDVGERFTSIDGIAEDVEHPGENFFSHRRFQRAARVDHRRPPSQALGWSQGNSSHEMSAQLRPYFNDNSTVFTSLQERVDRRKLARELNIDDTAAYRNDRAEIGCDFATHGRRR